MKKFFRISMKWLLRILLGLVSLLVLVFILFYLFRGKIIDRSIAYINDSQPGEIYLGNLNLRPFMNFPDVSLQLKDILYSAPETGDIGQDSVPVLKMEEVYVSLNIMKLLRGSYNISKVRLGEGELNYLVNADSISNLERALGIRFDEPVTEDSLSGDSSAIVLDMKSLEIRNLALNYRDIPAKTFAALKINGLESAFSYFPDTIQAALMTHLNITSASINSIDIGKPRTLSFTSSLLFDQANQKITLDRTMLDLKDAILELEGEVLLSESSLDLNFSAKNKGIELLNFLLSGVLNLDAIEQIGEGQIQFNGSASGSYKDQIPLVKLNFMASDVGFLIHTIDQSVTDIGFEGYASNGSKKDLSEAEIRLDNFHVTFPEGSMDANIHLKNFKAPVAVIEMNGDAELSVLNEVLKTEAVKDMKGKLNFEGRIDGSIDRLSGGFLDNAGALTVSLNDVSFVLPQNTVENLSGRIELEEEKIGFRGLTIRVDSNTIFLDGSMNNLLPYLLGFDVDPELIVSVSSKELFLEKLLGDTVFSGPIKDFGLRMVVKMPGKEFTKLLHSEIPEASLSMDNFHAQFPGYAPVSRLAFRMNIDSTKLSISKFQGRVGESSIRLDAEVRNYNAYLSKDSSASIGVSFFIDSRQIWLRDLLTVNKEFMYLPDSYTDERISDFRFKGNVETTVSQLLNTSGIPDIEFTSDELHWAFVKYPLELKDFDIDLATRDSVIFVNSFKGTVGESDLNLKASIANLFDSTKLVSGKIDLSSDLLNVSQLLNYNLFLAQEGSEEMAAPDTAVQGPLGLDQFPFPDLDLNLDLHEIRIEGNELYGMKGALRLRSYKILYFDAFQVQSKTGGTVVLDGQFNVSDPEMYMLSTSLNIDTVNVKDFNLQIAMEDTIYSLEDNFNGKLSADGIAELFLNPDFSVNLDYSTAVFNVRLEDGRVKNFTPLHALAKFTGNKDLDNIKFGLLRNSFTLISGGVQIPLMSIESNLGLILLEGEQKLDGDFLYLARVPVKLVRGTAWNVLTNQQRKEAEEAEVQKMEAQKFMLVTISSKGGAEDVKIGDKREKFED